MVSYSQRDCIKTNRIWFWKRNKKKSYEIFMIILKTRNRYTSLVEVSKVEFAVYFSIYFEYLFSSTLLILLQVRISSLVWIGMKMLIHIHSCLFKQKINMYTYNVCLLRIYIAWGCNITSSGDKIIEHISFLSHFHWASWSVFIFLWRFQWANV